MNYERLEQMKEKSIRSKVKEAYYRGHNKGVKEGFLRGALATMATVAILTAGYVGYGFFTSPSVPNPTIIASNQSFTENAHTNKNTFENWVDFQKVAEDYDPETMDFDAYVYTIYCRLNYVGDKQRLIDMNQLFRQLNLLGKSEYDDFVSYCKDRGLCIETDKGYQVDEKRYRKALSDYINSYNERLKAEQEMNKFKGGMHQ